MEPETKKRKFIRPPPRRNSITPSPSPTAGNKDPAFLLTTTTTVTKPTVNVDQSGVGVDPRIQHAKNHAIGQAQQDASKANFKIIDSPFGNFLVPVVPTRAELDIDYLPRDEKSNWETMCHGAHLLAAKIDRRDTTYVGSEEKKDVKALDDSGYTNNTSIACRTMVLTTLNKLLGQDA